MAERATNVHEDLTGPQRARLCIATELIDVSNTDLDGLDLLRYAHWVDTGGHPDGVAEVVEEPDSVQIEGNVTAGTYELTNLNTGAKSGPLPYHSSAAEHAVALARISGPGVWSQAVT